MSCANICVLYIRISHTQALTAARQLGHEGPLVLDGLTRFVIHVPWLSPAYQLSSPLPLFSPILSSLLLPRAPHPSSSLLSLSVFLTSGEGSSSEDTSDEMYARMHKLMSDEEHRRYEEAAAGMEEVWGMMY